MEIERFVTELARIRLDGVFNPYVDRCEISDRREAPAIRRANLAAYMRAAEGRVAAIWFGRDLGYRGGRRTGLALTDEHHLEALSLRYGGVQVAQATKGPPVSERTAAVVWSVLRRLLNAPFLWNVFPLHPYEPDDPMSNRCHTPAERRVCAPVVRALVEWVRPGHLVAIGKDAHKALNELGYACHYVRHPSYGGQVEFVRGMEELYGFVSDGKQKMD